MRGLNYLFLAFALVLCSCASTVKKETLPLTAADSSAIAAAVLAKTTPKKQEKPKLATNIDAAHESFIRALEMDLRGEKVLANIFWQHAAESDPYNRYLAFKLAEILMVQGDDSLALVQAERALQLKGKPSANELSLLAHLYVKAGAIDSCRKYFNAALDSAKYQDMTLLYDYCLFLEAVQDSEELVRVYDLLLPQVNYMPSLFQRQLKLLVGLKKDSAIVDLFGKAFEATGEKEMLGQYVGGLIFTNRIKEAGVVIDNISGTSPEEEDAIVLYITTLSETDKALAYKVLQKKYYEDHIQTPNLANYLGQYYRETGNVDSAKVLLKYVTEKGEGNIVFKAYMGLVAMALQQNEYKLAINYAERADSLFNGVDKITLASTYGLSGEYKKAYKILDSLVIAWEKWQPMEGIADSLTMLRMEDDVMHNLNRGRLVYANLLCDNALQIEQKNVGDTTIKKQTKELRNRAENFYSTLLQRDSLNAYLMMIRAMNLERMGNYESSFKIFETLLDSTSKAKFKDVPELLNYYGYTLIDLNRTPEELDRGIKMLEKAIALSDSSKIPEPYLDSYAWGLFHKGDFENALKIMAKINSDELKKDYVYWEHLGAIQEALGQKKEAINSYKQLKKMQPKHPAVKRFFKTK